MMKLTPRDKRLVIWLPALAISISYFWFIASQPNSRIKTLAKQTAQAIEKAPKPWETADYEEKLIRLRRDLSTTEAKSAQAKTNLAALIEGSSRKAGEARVAEQFAALLPRHGLALVEQAPLGTVPIALPLSLQRLAAQSRALLGTGGPAFWQVKFVGRYLDVVAALDELFTSDLPAIPATLAMTDGPQPETKLWTLVLWM